VFGKNRELKQELKLELETLELLEEENRHSSGVVQFECERRELLAAEITCKVVIAW
jgi:hypothetical protein